MLRLSTSYHSHDNITAVDELLKLSMDELTQMLDKRAAIAKEGHIKVGLVGRAKLLAPTSLPLPLLPPFDWPSQRRSPLLCHRGRLWRWPR